MFQVVKIIITETRQMFIFLTRLDKTEDSNNLAHRDCVVVFGKDFIDGSNIVPKPPKILQYYHHLSLSHDECLGVKVTVVDALI